MVPRLATGYAARVRLSFALVLVGAGACGAPARPVTVGNTTVAPDAHGGGGSLADATSIEIKDVWVGLGCTHEFSATLAAGGGAFTGQAQLATGWGRDNGQTKTITIKADVIVALARAVDDARARMAATQAPEGLIVSSWTDDYPTGSMTFATPSGTYQLAFEDQHRKLVFTHDRDEAVPLDRDQDLFDGKPSPIWLAYTAVLEAAGLPAWIDAMCDRG